VRISYLLKNNSAFIVGFFLCFALSGLTAQDFKYEEYAWDKNPTSYTLPDSLAEEEALYLKYHFYVEFNS